MESEDGELFIKSLAFYVRKHEKALATALQSQRQPRKPTMSARDSLQANRHGSTFPSSSSPPPSASTASSSFAAALGLPFRTTSASAYNNPMTKLALTPNQLYYLLSRFQELNVPVGPMNIRLESMHPEPSSSNYVSFLTQVKRPSGRSADQESLHSVSSVRSVVSNLSNVWSNLGFSTEAKLEKRRAALMEDIRYLYSAFTKIPCVKLAVDHRARRIASYEEFPFDTAVPIHVFKNLTSLEIKDTDFRAFFGWDVLADQLRYLTVKRAGLDDPADVLTNIVLDDTDKRRRRSSKQQASPIVPYGISNPFSRYAELTRTISTPPGSSLREGKRMSPNDRVSSSRDQNANESDPTKQPAHKETRSISPSRQETSRRGSTHLPMRRAGKNRRSSSTSSGSAPSSTNRNSSSNLLALGQLPSTKWRFLSHLSISDNGLTSLTAPSLSPVAGTLQSLDLSSNLFTEIPESLTSLTALRALNLSNCMIESLRSLSRHPLPAITVLNLRLNRLSSLAGVEKLLSLERLDLRDNRLKDPTEIARLTSIPEFREVYVVKNPFAKTHANYRITIFNLFRSVPGYLGDISIDSTGPGYSERRQLADRALLLPAVPVVKPPVEDDIEQIESTRPEQARDILHDVDETTTPQTPLTSTGSQSQRKRKGPKRRVVSISQSNDSPIGHSDHSITQSHSMMANGSPDPLPMRRSKGLPLPFQAEQDDVPNQSSTEQTASEPQTPTGPDEHFEPPRADFAVSSDLYRRRIEALKQDHGSGWLTALADENWADQTNHLDTGAETAATKYAIPDPGKMPLRPAIDNVSPMLAGGRTLGRTKSQF